MSLLIDTQETLRRRTSLGGHFPLVTPYESSSANETLGILPINESANFKAEVQFDKEDMARNINYSRHRRMFDSIFCGKIQSIESDSPE